MTCNGKTYITDPSRLWNRVQLPCSSYDLSPIEYQNYLMMKKGNVLQYKKNSSSLTRNQIYSRMAQGKWTNRNTTWAIQNERGYTNPNTKMLKRNNTTNIIISDPTIVETTLPITCPSIPDNRNNVLPNNEENQGENEGPNPELPPPEPETANGGSVLPYTPNADIPPKPIVVPDFGTLSCNIIENACISYQQVKQSNELYHPTTDSDVPGPIQLLYWDESIQSWYPREQITMNSSDNKWPYTSGPPEDYTYIAATAYNN